MKFCAIAACLMAALFFALIGSKAVSPKDVAKPVEPSERLLPGQPLPIDADCFWESYMYADLSCRANDKGQQVYFSYDRNRRQIVDTAITQDITVGELILAWGLPTGEERGSYLIDVAWPGRYAYIYSGEFSPSSRVAFISYALNTRPTSSWRGFVNGR